MRFSDADIARIYDRTSGKCHLCHKKLALTNYGRFGERGAWEVEHSRARARGGSDRLTNLYAACISCNRSKGIVPTRTARRRNGLRKAPLSTSKRRTEKRWNAVGGAALGAVAGGFLLGPVGAYVGAVLLGSAMHDRDPDKT